ncbi:MAG TPA: hypothetical protein VD993_05045 [Chitinophagaceae bacterium]|nr:hypothetical protein [Chitinophagaceae bacterium]
MDVLEKAYDYIDYTLSELSKLEGNCVSLLYFFKLFSPAGKLAQQILMDNSFITVEKESNVSVVCITEKGREVVQRGGVREYLGYLDEQDRTKKQKAKAIRKMFALAAFVAGAVLVTGYALRVTKT